MEFYLPRGSIFPLWEGLSMPSFSIRINLNQNLSIIQEARFFQMTRSALKKILKEYLRKCYLQKKRKIIPFMFAQQFLLNQTKLSLPWN